MLTALGQRKPGGGQPQPTEPCPATTHWCTARPSVPTPENMTGQQNPNAFPSHWKDSDGILCFAPGIFVQLISTGLGFRVRQLDGRDATANSRSADRPWRRPPTMKHAPMKAELRGRIVCRMSCSIRHRPGPARGFLTSHPHCCK